MTQLILMGLGSLCVGIVLIVKWRDIVRDCTKSEPLLEKWFSHRFGTNRLNVFSKRASFIIGAFVVNFLGVVCLVAGLIFLYSGVTDRDWPLHHAQCKDVWPF